MQQYHPHIVRIPLHQAAPTANSRMFPILLANLVSNALTPRSPPRRRPPPGRASKAKRRAKPINRALQGGGAHGAFPWGVLDQLLHNGTIGIDAPSAPPALAAIPPLPADPLTPPRP